MNDIPESPEPSELQSKPFKPKSVFKIAIISIICVIALVIAVMFYFFIWKGDSSPAEETYIEMVEFANEGEYNEALNLTILKLILSESELNEILNQVEDEISHYVSIHTTVNSIEMIPEDEINQNEKAIAQIFFSLLEQSYDFEISNQCLLLVDTTITYDSETQTNTTEVWCLEIDSSWYVGFSLSMDFGFVFLPEDFFSELP